MHKTVPYMLDEIKASVDKCSGEKSFRCQNKFPLLQYHVPEGLPWYKHGSLFMQQVLPSWSRVLVYAKFDTKKQTNNKKKKTDRVLIKPSCHVITYTWHGGESGSMQQFADFGS